MAKQMVVMGIVGVMLATVGLGDVRSGLLDAEEKYELTSGAAAIVAGPTTARRVGGKTSFTIEDDAAATTGYRPRAYYNAASE